MKRSFLIGAGAVATTAAAAALCGSGIASAGEQFNGQTYAEAKQALSQAGMTGKIGTVSGDELPIEQCIVTGSQTMDVAGSSGGTGGSEVVLHLNCNASAAPASKAASLP